MYTVPLLHLWVIAHKRNLVFFGILANVVHRAGVW